MITTTVNRKRVVSYTISGEARRGILWMVDGRVALTNATGEPVAMPAGAQVWDINADAPITLEQDTPDRMGFDELRALREAYDRGVDRSSAGVRLLRRAKLADAVELIAHRLGADEVDQARVAHKIEQETRSPDGRREDGGRRRLGTFAVYTGATDRAVLIASEAHGDVWEVVSKRGRVVALYAGHDITVEIATCSSDEDIDAHVSVE